MRRSGSRVLVSVAAAAAVVAGPLVGASAQEDAAGVAAAPVVVVGPDGVFRAREVDHDNKPSSAPRIYVERNVEAAGMGDYDADGDGWALLGRTNGAGDNGWLARFWVQDGVPYAATRHHKKGCLTLTPRSLEVVTKGQTRFMDQVADTANCRGEDPSADVDGDGVPDDMQDLYRVTDDGRRLYLQRNTIAAEAQLGVSDWDPDGDGWSAYARTNGSGEYGTFIRLDEADDGSVSVWVEHRKKGCTVLAPNRTDTVAKGQTRRLRVSERIGGACPDGDPVDTTAPPVPSGLAATAGDGMVQLSWDPVEVDDLLGYRVWKSDTSDGPWAPLTADPITDPSTTLDGLPNSVEVWAAVSAVDTSGNESAYSAPVRSLPVGTSAISTGGETVVRLAGVIVVASAGAIRPGETLQIREFEGPVPGAPEGSFLSTPVDLTTSQGQPAGPVEVSFGYEAANLRDGSGPLVLHEDLESGVWLPEDTLIDPTSGVASATLTSFSGVGFADRFAWGVGYISGNRTNQPITCSIAPDWVVDTRFTPPSIDGEPASINEALYSCPGDSTNSEFALRVQNNRGHVMAFEVLGAELDVERSTWPTTATGALMSAAYRAIDNASKANVVLPPGEAATLMIKRPDDLVGRQLVTLNELPDGAAVWLSLGLSFLDKVAPLLSGPAQAASAYAGMADCVAASYDAGDDPNLPIDQAGAVLNECIDTIPELLDDGSTWKVAAKSAAKRLAAALFVVDAGASLIDAWADDAFPPGLKFEFDGLPVFIDVELANGDLGDVPDGEVTTLQLKATGGTPPYSWLISRGDVNEGRVPEWAALSDSGLLRLAVPEGTIGSYGFFVTIRQQNGQQSTFGSQLVRFNIGIAGAAEDYIVRDPDSGRAVRVVDGTVLDIPDGGTFLCLAETRLVWDQADNPYLERKSGQPAGVTGCDNRNRTRWDIRPEGNIGTDIILRNPDGAAWLINSAGEIQTVPDGGTYLCLAASNPVIWNVPQSAIDTWPDIGETPATCGACGGDDLDGREPTEFSFPRPNEATSSFEVVTPASNGWWLLASRPGGETGWTYQWVGPDGSVGCSWESDFTPEGGFAGDGGEVFVVGEDLTRPYGFDQRKLFRVGPGGFEDELELGLNQTFGSSGNVVMGLDGNLYWNNDDDTRTMWINQIDAETLQVMARVSVTPTVNVQIQATEAGVVALNPGGTTWVVPYDQFSARDGEQWGGRLPVNRAKYGRYSVGLDGSVAGVVYPGMNYCSDAIAYYLKPDGTSWSKTLPALIGSDLADCRMEDVDARPGGGVIYTLTVRTGADEGTYLLRVSDAGDQEGFVRIDRAGTTTTTAIDDDGLVLTSYTRQEDCPGDLLADRCSRAILVGHRDGTEVLRDAWVEPGRQTERTNKARVGPSEIFLGNGQVGAFVSDWCGSNDTCSDYRRVPKFRTKLVDTKIPTKPPNAWW